MNILKKQAIKTNVFIFFTLLLMWLLGSMRPLGFDADSIGYFHIMDKIIYEDYLYIEPMFIFFTKISYNIFGDEYYQRMVFFIFSTLNIIFLYLGIKRCCKYYFISIIIYIFMFFPILSMTQMRFSIAVSLFIYAIQDIEKKSFLYFFKIGIAFMFHYSAILFLPFYFINAKSKSSLYSLFIFISIIFVFFKNIIINFLIEFRNLEYVPQYLSDKIYNNLIQNLSLNSFNIINIQILFTLLVYFFSKKYLKENVYLKILAIGISLYFLFSFSVIISFRMYNAYCIVIIFLIPLLMERMKNKNFIFIFTIMILYLFLFNTIIKNSLFNWSVLL